VFAASSPLAGRVYKKTSTQNWYGIRGSAPSYVIPVGGIGLMFSEAVRRRLLGEFAVATGRPLLLALLLGLVFELERCVVFGLAWLSCPAAILVLCLRDECRVGDAETL
jgi:hypothetical protein